jgi:cysteine desulfurase
VGEGARQGGWGVKTIMNNTSRPIYLDYMATTPIDERVAEKMWHYMTYAGEFGNPASTSHIYGQRASLAVEEARESVAALIHAEPDEIIWTSGATEANNLAIKGACRFYQRKGKHIITVTTEHKAVLEPFDQLEREGFDVTRLSPLPNGVLQLDMLEKALRSDTIFVSVMHANNEIGVIQDISAIGHLLQKKGIIFHVDAAQSAGKIPIDVHAMSISLMSLSAHKIYGPKGIGALFVSHQPRIRLESLLHGGAQEQGLRAGTLATHQIVGMGEAFRLAQILLPTESQKILTLRQMLWDGLKTILGIHLNGDEVQRVPGNLNVSIENIDGNELRLALKNLAFSSTSACTSGSVEPSYVLKALHVPRDLAQSTLRLSIGRYTTESDISIAIESITQNVNRLAHKA